MHGELHGPEAADRGRGRVRTGSGPGACGEVLPSAVFTTTCDQMRRVAEMIGRECPVPSFLFHVPATWQTVGACGLYCSELERLGRFLCRLGGAPPDRKTLVEVMEACDVARRRLRDARGWLTGCALVEAIRGDSPGSGNGLRHDPDVRPDAEGDTVGDGRSGTDGGSSRRVGLYRGSGRPNRTRWDHDGGTFSGGGV